MNSLEEISIPPEVVSEFGASLVHVEWQVRHFLDEKSVQVRTLVEGLMESLPHRAVHAYISGSASGLPSKESPTSEQQHDARVEILSRLISKEVNLKRSELIRNATRDPRPPPYNHIALEDVPITSENLIDLDFLSSSPRILARNGYVFELAPSLPALNSSYWLMQNLRIEYQDVTKYIRLDPLCIQKMDEYRSAAYKMWIYGVPLDWHQVSTLKADQHGRWMPGPLSTPSAFTDVVWSPRSSEVHFICEEVPTIEQAPMRGGRYLHAVFIPDDRRFNHIDGAIRYYSPSEVESRLRTHVRRAGKAGERVKIFRVDGNIETELWSALVSSFFVWNDDVMRYVGGEVPFPSELDAS